MNRIIKKMLHTYLNFGMFRWHRYVDWCIEEERKARQVQKFAAKIFNARQHRMLTRWQQYIEMIHFEKRQMERIIKSMMRAYQSNGLRKWKSFAEAFHAAKVSQRV